MDTGEARTTAIDYLTEERFVSLRRALGVGAFGLNQITLQPGQRGRIHRHARQEEVYLVLRGRLMVLLEQDEELELGEGELAHVPSGTRRQLANPFSAACTLVAIGAAGEHEGRDGEAFSDWSDLEGRPPAEVPLPEDLP
jgi:mannose-6-phosphate isomerase-like protein (cupin superfamily)